MESLKRFAGRALFHLSTLACALGISLWTAAAAHPSTLLLSTFSWYFGLVLLIRPPRGNFRRSAYLMPAVAGAVSAAVLAAALAVTPCAAVFAGGALSYLLSRACRSDLPASEWLGLVPLLTGCLMWLPQFGIFTADILIPVTLLSAAAAALALCRVLGHFETVGALKAELQAALLKLKAACLDPEIPPAVRNAIGALSCLQDPEGSGLRNLQSQVAARDLILKAAAVLEPLKRRIDPESGRTLDAVQYEICVEGMLGLLRELDACVAAGDGGASPDPLSPYADECRRFESLASSGGTLPQDMQLSLMRIGRSGRDIIALVYREPAHYAQGTAFLKRYLGFADHVLSECSYLSSQSGDPERLRRVLKRSAELLSRLAAVFERKARDLTERDFEDFESELKAFEEFMRMRGQ